MTKEQNSKIDYYMYLFSFPTYLLFANIMIYLTGQIGLGSIILFIFGLVNIPIFYKYRRLYFNSEIKLR